MLKSVVGKLVSHDYSMGPDTIKSFYYLLQIAHLFLQMPSRMKSWSPPSSSLANLPATNVQATFATLNGNVISTVEVWADLPHSPFEFDLAGGPVGSNADC